MINQFLGEVKNRGLARTNRYDVVIPLPVVTSSKTIYVANLFCDAVSLPGVNISTTPQRFYGEERQMPYERMFDPVTLSFYVDNTMELKTAFEEWINLIIDPKTRAIGYYNDYTRPVEIYIKDVEDGTPYKLTLHEAYPKALNTIQLDTSSREIMKMTMTMQYKYWTSTSNTLEVYNGENRDSFDPPLSRILELIP